MLKTLFAIGLSSAILLGSSGFVPASAQDQAKSKETVKSKIQSKVKSQAKSKVEAKKKGSAAAPVVDPRSGESETIVLFDGKSLDGWAGHFKYWSVENGEIVGKNKAPIAVSTYLLSERNFTDFRLKARVKLVESEMHSGIAFWGRVASERNDPATYAGHLVMFPSGWGMYDLYGRNGLPVDPAPAKKVGKQHDWNDLEILAQGNRIRVAVNGTTVIDWRDPEPERIKAGPIALQLHSNQVPQEVRFKDLVIETFPKEDRLTTVK
ncbi:MAG: DUF1080 domain-containing protein [Isosphaeraceae bacterium]|nr:DUF1080 domain-containing protein [Isosphaeraceae bacterium]